MKAVLTALALVAILGCDTKVQPPPPDGWAEKAALDWAVELGDNSPKSTCLNTRYYMADGAEGSYCSVNAFGHIHKLWCHYPEMKCYEELPGR